MCAVRADPARGRSRTPPSTPARSADALPGGPDPACGSGVRVGHAGRSRKILPLSRACHPLPSRKNPVPSLARHPLPSRKIPVSSADSGIFCDGSAPQRRTSAAEADEVSQRRESTPRQREPAPRQRIGALCRSASVPSPSPPSRDTHPSRARLPLPSQKIPVSSADSGMFCDGSAPQRRTSAAEADEGTAEAGTHAASARGTPRQRTSTPRQREARRVGERHARVSGNPRRASANPRRVSGCRRTRAASTRTAPRT